MNREEAKAVLRAWRAGAAPEGDPLTKEAFARLETDPSLAEWFEAEQAFNRGVEDAMGDIPVPSALRERILAAAPTPQRGKIRRFPALLSLAASLVALAFVGLLVFDPSAVEAESDLAGLYDHVSATSDMPPDPGTESTDFSELRRYLVDRGASVTDVLPEPLELLSPTGANVTDWIGRVVGVVHLEDDGGEGFRLFLLDANAVPNAGELPSSPELRRLRGIPLLIWSEDGILHALATGGPETNLLPFVEE